jgi:hypothetical protein
MIGQIDDLALTGSVDCAVRLVDEALQAFGVPVVASGLAFVAIHALLNDSPLAVIGDEEAMEIEFEAVLDGGAVDLGHQPTGTRERRSVEARALGEGHQFLRRPARMLPSAAAYGDAELTLQRGKPALQRADHARGDA